MFCKKKKWYKGALQRFIDILDTYDGHGITCVDLMIYDYRIQEAKTIGES